MSPVTLSWDDGYDEREITAPTRQDVETRATALDGHHRTLVTLTRDDTHLAIGGSAASGLVVYCTYENDTIWQLISDGNPSESVTVTAGGQAGAYPKNYVVNLEAAMAAGVGFLEQGTLAEGLR